MSDEDEWLNSDIHADDATGPASAALLESVAQALREGPDGKRYDIDLSVDLAEDPDERDHLEIDVDIQATE